MLSKDLRDLFNELDDGDSLAKRRRVIYSALFDIAKQIRLMREASGLSIRKFARELNTSHSTVLRWETPGYAGYTLSKLIEISHVLGYRVILNFVPLTGDFSVVSDWKSVDGKQLSLSKVIVNNEKNDRTADEKKQLTAWEELAQIEGVAHV